MKSAILALSLAACVSSANATYIVKQAGTFTTPTSELATCHAGGHAIAAQSTCDVVGGTLLERLDDATSVSCVGQPSTAGAPVTVTATVVCQ
jgi:hypothetical protein